LQRVLLAQPPAPGDPSLAPPPGEAPACEAEAGALGMGIVAAIAVLCIALGFLLGTRARQLLASAKLILQAFKYMRGIKIPADDGADDDGAKDGDDDMDQEDESGSDLLEAFLTTDAEALLDDHQDMTINPVLMYQIRVAADRRKEEQRNMERRKALEAEGLDAAAIEQQLLEMAESGAMPSGAVAQKACALNVLIEAGARVTALASSGGAEAAVKEERKRQQRSVEFYLRGRDVAVEKDKAKTRNAKGMHLKTASEVARDSEHARVGGSTFERAVRNLPIAKAGRNILRDYNERLLADKARRGEEDPEEWDAASDGDEAKRRQDDMGLQKRERGGGQINQADLMRLAAELGEEDLIPDEGDNDSDVEA